MNARIALFSWGVAVASFGIAAAQATTERDSVDSSGAQGNGNSGLIDPAHNYSLGMSMSGDATVVAFVSEATNLVAGDTNGKRDIFVHVRPTGSTERVSVDSSGAEANGHSAFPSCSVDGTWIAFESDATNLVAGDANGATDVFVRDRSAGTTERVSISSSGFGGNSYSVGSSISSDGQIVAFVSAATNLVAGDTNKNLDIFVHDRSAGTTERVSVDSSGVQSNGDSYDPAISSDGRFVVFSSAATNLVVNDTNGFVDVFVHDRVTGVTERVSLTSAGAETDGDNSTYLGGQLISADGMIIAFTSSAPDLGASVATREIFVHDRSSGITELVSVLPPDVFHNGWPNYGPSMSTDGQTVSFWNEDNYDVYVRDRSRGVTELISVDSSGNRGNGIWPSISADGQVVAFESISSKLVPNDTNGFSDVFVHERCEVDASWSNYGQGFPGTNGIPSFTALSNPVRGSSLTLDVGNSSGLYSFGLLELGYQRATIPSAWGGDLLVSPALTVAIGLAPTGTSLNGGLPHDDRLCGVVVDLQVLEIDPGAAKGVSFTQGLELVIGQ